MTWEVEEGVRCVVCPGCAFTFDAVHVTDSTGEYDCPVCRQSKLETALREIVATAEQYMDIGRGDLDGRIDSAHAALETSVSPDKEKVASDT